MFKINNILRNKSFITTISWLLCLIFVLQIANKSVYFHTHITNKGEVVSHAHPFNKSSDSNPFKNHQHSNYDYSFLSQLNLLFLLFFVAISALFCSLQKQIFNRTKTEKYFSDFIFQKSGRSPPIQLFNLLFQYLHQIFYSIKTLR